MTNQDQNLFIVEDNAETAIKLHKYLQGKFGTIYNIFTFENAVQALTKVDKHTSIVILDYDYFGDEGNKIVNFIKNINEKTKVIILSNNDDSAASLQDFYRSPLKRFAPSLHGDKPTLSHESYPDSLDDVHIE